MNRPHQLSPQQQTIRCLIVYKNFAAAIGISHIGLGVAALNTSQVLRAAGVWVDVMAISSAADLDAKIAAIDAQAIQRGEVTLSNVVVSAPWIPTTDFNRLLGKYPAIDFACVSHSNVAFLHADPNGMRLLREGMDLQAQWHNFHLAGNSRKFIEWMLRAYGTQLTYLPNLYNLDQSATRNLRSRPMYTGGGPLRIGSFGAIRVLKNHMTACAAALEIGRRLGVDTEFWLSYGRAEGALGVIKSIQQMAQGVRNFTLRQNTWETWPQFRATIRGMNLLLQPSFTESFNMVSADGVAEGVPSVTSESIEWVPEHWKAQADNALDIANTGVALIYDPIAPSEGWNSLELHNDAGTRAWKQWLLPTIKPF